MNIYVGNLSYDTDDQALREVFEKYGSVDSVNVILDKFSGRSKGFGFIEMPDNSEAQKALDELDGKELDGRNIKVNQAKPREERGGGNRY
jgi:RNA recognition motif-containing protein